MISLERGSKLKGILLSEANEYTRNRRRRFRSKLPKGCFYCAKGSKLVLLVTGLCNRRCFYCPLSKEKKGKDVVYANERRVHIDNDIIEEAKLIDALGTGITGGDPMLVPKKTLHYIELLKKNFGAKHHIHIYTANAFDTKWLEKLSSAGLDEIRFHPPIGIWNRLQNTNYEILIREALKTNMDVGIEIPVLPNYEDKIISLLQHASNLGVHFVNLNELEYSETNYRALNNLGYDVKTDVSSAVKGSERTALRIMKKIDLNMTLHYCSSSFKDAVQLRNRIMRRAKNIAKKYDIITRDGTLLKGVIECKNPAGTRRLLMKNFGIPESLIAVEHEKKRIELASWILEKISKYLPYSCFIVEEYPTADRLEVERIDLKRQKKY